MHPPVRACQQSMLVLCCTAAISQVTSSRATATAQMFAVWSLQILSHAEIHSAREETILAQTSRQQAQMSGFTVHH